ncbi:UpxY family transcription antiterminator [Marinilongibacter aquaticus]|uniref:UpxY family transcription antiterminator n=1 Tax=Marinilongibacter aquaticus TaxID=2975157 RepID=UPI0021BD4B7B|nr:UpxY family transcription antiterminator [Marinilongibacter aquaticus]UBM58068.1 UpxY family transcription antiterminator [Marinilongibacter aquaticus]
MDKNSLNWYVLYTKSRSEKKVADQLDQLDLHAFCPCIRKVKQWSDRKKVVDEPLFKSYVFVRLKETEKRKVYEAPGVVGFVNWLNKPAIVRESEIANIKEMLCDYAHQEIEVEEFSPEDRIEIKSGPLQNQQGLVTKQNGKTLSLFIPALRMKVVVNLGSNQVNLIQKKRYNKTNS